MELLAGLARISFFSGKLNRDIAKFRVNLSKKGKQDTIVVSAFFHIAKCEHGNSDIREGLD